ncbi:hypothetical protein, conserved [Leishmania donovani]|uniref:Amastin surface glycofamily protein n=1 Tax=Leishmania donovani TaxID=5661 RepID=A0A3S7X1H6_LEIDO|nr:hypothetical protein, conserved [Leishmania donovani]AYU80301.1 Amastin surface glycoprotein, putative [Leishmania donovani]TPP54283.1 Amastin surface glycofamily protein [Leishmania donovani]CBZ35555.1 hypothetical protein, conserved [Leishmania donovani]
MTMQGQGNNVPQRHQQSQLDSDDESYTGSSGSYSEMVSEASKRQQQSAAVAERRLSPKVEQGNRTRGLQQTPSPVKRGDAQGTQQEEGGETAQKKGRAARGKAKARTMMNAALEAPVARVRAVTEAVSGRDSQRVTIYVFFCIAWVHLIFVILSSALSQIDVVGGGCYTFWGYKANCDTVSYTRRTVLLQRCSRVRSILQAGSAFSIISVLASAATLVTSWVLCCRLREADRHVRSPSGYANMDEVALAQEPGCNEGIENGSQADAPVYDAGDLKKVMMIVVAFSLACELTCWALIAAIITERYCDEIYLWSTTATYGVGFGLGLTAWLAELIAYIVFATVV